MSLGRDNSEEIRRLGNRVERLEKVVSLLIEQLDNLDELPYGVCDQAKELLTEELCSKCGKPKDDGFLCDNSYFHGTYCP